MCSAWLSLRRVQSWWENTSKSSSSKVSRWVRSVAVRVVENGGLSTLGSAGSGIGVQPPDEVSPPPSTANALPDCTARSARKPSPTAPPVLNRDSPLDLSSAHRVMTSLPFSQPELYPR